MSIEFIFDREFHEKLVTINTNALLIMKKEPPLDIELYRTHKAAVRSFLNKNFLASIFFSSIGVEAYLNKVLNMRKWENLNLKLLKTAHRLGIPVSELLDDEERDLFEKESLKKLKDLGFKPLFCERRNKILHGDFTGLASQFDLPEIEHIKMKFGEKAYLTHIFSEIKSGYCQLLKFQKFLLKIKP